MSPTTDDTSHLSSPPTPVSLLVLPHISTILLMILTFLTIYHFLIYPYLLCPLRHIPRAHWSVPIPILGHLPTLRTRYLQTNNHTTHHLHNLHGPVIRLTPTELSINCYTGGLKTIYPGGFEKHEWYPRQFANFGVLNMFSTVGHAAHASKKRIMANVYSKSFIARSEQVRVNSAVLLGQRICPLIEGLAKTGQPTDVHELNNAFTMDFMTAFQFGIARSSNFTQDEVVRRKYLGLYHSRREFQFVSSEVSPVVRKWLKRVGVSLYPGWVSGVNEWLEQWALGMCEAAEGYLKSLSGGSVDSKRKEQGEGENEDESESVGNEPVVFKTYRNGLFKLRAKEPMAGVEVHPHLNEGMNFRGLKSGGEESTIVPDKKTTLLEVYSDMVDQLAAGHETSAIALTYLYYELSRHPEMQDRLYDEVRTLEPDIEWPPSSVSPDQWELPPTKDIDNLPFLNALVLEVLRLHAPIPGMQPRITPSVPGGVSLGPPGTKHHYTNIPGNIRVSAMAYTLHRIPEVFPEAESFIPSRWLPASSEPYGSTEEQLTEMNRHFWAFGSGGRMCIGKHFALQEIKLIVSAIYRNWRTEIVDAEGIEELDAYTTRPTSGKLILRFVHRLSRRRVFSFVNELGESDSENEVALK